MRSSALASVVSALLLSACCGREAPTWSDLEPVYLDGGSVTIDLAEHVRDDRGVPTFAVASNPSDLLLELSGSRLTLTPQPGWRETAVIELSATDRCDNVSLVELAVDGGAPPDSPGGDCEIALTYRSPGAPDAVAVAGSFNDWATDGDPMTLGDDGAWHATLRLAPGAYPYKLVELDEGVFGAEEAWSCDPQAEYVQCDAGYKQPWDTSWDQVCAPGVASCNSLLVVEPCHAPRLEVAELSIDRSARSVQVVVNATPGSGGAVDQAQVTLDGQPVEGWDGARFDLALTGLAPGRHTLRFDAVDAAGNAAEQVYVPFWLDDFEWEDAVLYFAFVDRIQNGDPSLDFPEGETAANGGGYLGGDFRGLIDALPYLDDLGVDVLWLSNAQDNAEGAWAGDCDLTFTGYHAYWPDDPYGIEEHFGDEDTFAELIDAAHARGMRVVMDWVANHVHEDHPYYRDHPEWFNPLQVCKDQVDGQSNFDRIPETCWFAPYLPDIDYYQPEPLVAMVDDAIWWARTYELDGFRVDAVKHMSHAVSWNLSSAVRRHLQHERAGGDERFWTIGETFDGAAQIKAYLGDNQLDGQFDFPLYWALRAAFVYDSASLPDLMAQLDASRADFEGSLMSNFLGNHDVLRWTTDAWEGNLGACDGDALRIAGAPEDAWPYDRMMLAWTFLFTQPGVPLIYYGDELGIPGHHDPDNRQPLWWHVDLDGAASVEDVAGRAAPQQARVLRHVAALTAARKAHPALRRGGWIEWWQEPALYAYARSYAGDHALVVLNRTEDYRELPNGLSFAGLPSEGTYEDVLTGEVFHASDDQIVVSVPGRGSRVLVYRP